MKQLFIFIVCLLTIHIAIAHGVHDPKKHDPKKKATVKADSLAKQGPKPDSAQHQSAHRDNAADEAHSSDVSQKSAQHPHSVDEFPTLHPLIVHFPIMFLLIAALMQLAQFFVFKRELSWIVLILLVLGFIGAVVASKYVHPHTDGLTERAAQILKEHDLYADWTVWLSGIGCILKIIGHFVLKRKIWAEAIVAVVLTGAAYAVAMAGHHGAQLVHIEGVGPQGKFLETHEH